MGQAGRAGKAGKAGQAVVTATTAVVKTTRSNHTLRKTYDVGDDLKAWALKCSRNVPALRVLLGRSREVKPSDAGIVRECIARIPSRTVVQVCVSWIRVRFCFAGGRGCILLININSTAGVHLQRSQAPRSTSPLP